MNSYEGNVTGDPLDWNARDLTEVKSQRNLKSALHGTKKMKLRSGDKRLPPLGPTG